MRVALLLLVLLLVSGCASSSQAPNADTFPSGTGARDGSRPAVPADGDAAATSAPFVSPRIAAKGALNASVPLRTVTYDATARLYPTQCVQGCAPLVSTEFMLAFNGTLVGWDLWLEPVAGEDHPDTVRVTSFPGNWVETGALPVHSDNLSVAVPSGFGLRIIVTAADDVSPQLGLLRLSGTLTIADGYCAGPDDDPCEAVLPYPPLLEAGVEVVKVPFDRTTSMAAGCLPHLGACGFASLVCADECIGLEDPSQNQIGQALGVSGTIVGWSLAATVDAEFPVHGLVWWNGDRAIPINDNGPLPFPWRGASPDAWAASFTASEALGPLQIRVQGDLWVATGQCEDVGRESCMRVVAGPQT